MTDAIPGSTWSTGRPDPEDERLVLRDVTVAYGCNVVLRGVNAEAHRGQVIGVIGPNGGGKSTLLMAILGTVPLMGGHITLFGRSAASQRSRIAYMPQREVVDWDFPVAVREVVMMGRYPHIGWLRPPRQSDHAAVDRALGRVEMRAHARVQIGQLSGGQQQRVFLARALAQEADVLLLDEPLNAIDTPTQEVLLAVLEEQRAQGRIILLATHDLVSASCACDCLCCLNQRLVSFGPVRETYTPEILAATYGGPIIVLGPAPPSERVHAHRAGDHPHHARPSGQGLGGLRP